MSTIHVEVTAADIAGADPHINWRHPVEAALQRLTGQEIDIDHNGSSGHKHGYIATIGQGAWTLVIELPKPAAEFLDMRWDDGAPGEPFAFDIDVPGWVLDLVIRPGTFHFRAPSAGEPR